MALDRIDAPSSLPTAQSDYVAQNNQIETLILDTTKARAEISGNFIQQGAIFNIGGVLYIGTSDTSITGTPSNYIKITPSGSTASAAYVANLTGVNWNQSYNGYYDVSGNLYIFDELLAYINSAISVGETQLWNAIISMLGYDLPFTGDFQLTSGGKISGYATGDNSVKSASIAAGAASSSFKIKRPISGYIIAPSNANDSFYLQINQNFTWVTIATSSVASASSPLQLNPGTYRFLAGGAINPSPGSVFLACTGAFGILSITAGDIVT